MYNTQKYQTRIYHDKAKAEEALEYFKTHTLQHFCPLIKDICRVDCICYIEPRMTSQPTGSWVVYPGACDNAMFFGSGE